MGIKIYFVLYFSIIFIDNYKCKPHTSAFITDSSVSVSITPIPSTTGLDCMYYCDQFFCEKGYVRKILYPDEKCGCQYGLVQCPEIECPSGQYLAMNNENMCECPEKCEPCPDTCSPVSFYCDEYMKTNNTCGCTDCSIYPCIDCTG